MRNIKLIIEYDGTNYCGWQAQRCRALNSIQETIEKALKQLLQEKIHLIASGRTDSGVHALGQVANFKTKSSLSSRNIQRALNSLLPRDIRIKEAKDVRLKFHARFCAKSKFYRYMIVNDSFLSPFLCRRTHLVKCPLNVKKMKEVCHYFLGRHNFHSFQAVDKCKRKAWRSIKKLDIHKDKNIIYIDIEADGFLYRMVRNIVGTLIEVGRGRFKPQVIPKIFLAKNRISSGPCAPSEGLYLMQVKY